MDKSDKQPVDRSVREARTSFTSFPHDGFAEPHADPKVLSTFYDKVKQITSAATTVMQNVLPGTGAKEEEGFRSTSSSEERANLDYDLGINVDPQKFSDPNLVSGSGSSSPTPTKNSRSPIRYLQTSPKLSGGDLDLSFQNLASPSMVGVTTTHNQNLISTTKPKQGRNGRMEYHVSFSSDSGSRNRSAAFPQSMPYSGEHLPGYSGDMDASSDSESIVSTTKDYLTSRIDSRMNPLLKPGGLGKEFWMKDENANECFRCGKVFTAWRRKHHCRICGQIYCSSCTTLIPGDNFNFQGKMRICLSCLDVLDMYGNSSQSSFEENISRLDHFDAKSTTPLTPIDLAPPQPAPMMTIPATRMGESVEIYPADNTSITGSPRSNFGLPVSRKERSRLSAIEPLQRSYHSDGDSFVNGTGMDDIDTEGDEEEDEQAMSLFAALNSTRPDTELSTHEHRTAFLRPRSGTSISMEQGRQGLGLMKIGHRRKSFSEHNNNSNNNGGRRVIGRSRSGGFRSNNKSNERLSRSLSKLLPRHRSSLSTSRSVVYSSPSIDLNKASVNHVREFLRQLLWNYELPESWLEVLLDPLIECARNIDLDIKGGDNIDIRHYVKLKRVPGGSPKDTKYIDGIAFSKSLALKSMAREIVNPRVLLITFPIEYSRNDQHFMSLEPVLAQETEYLRKLVKRIVALRPNILLAGDLVSGFALQLLADAGISVIANVKESVISRVARYTRADVISSIDKLAVNPKLGDCGLFTVKTFRYKDVRKTFVFLSGIPKQLGCTILLRGGDMDVLANVKAVVEFMVYVVFNLRLETSLMIDQFVSIPTDTLEKVAPLTIRGLNSDEKNENSNVEKGKVEKDAVSSSAISINDTGYFNDLVRLQADKILSASPFIQFGYPYLLQVARHLEDNLVDMERRNEKLEYDDEKVMGEEFEKLELKISLNELPGGYDTVRDMVKAVNRRKVDRLFDLWSVQKRQWELTYAQSAFMFNPSMHQNIITLYSVVCNETVTPCVGPELLSIDFYSENDMTLGQFVEHVCWESDQPCPDACGRSLSGHYRSYVSGTGRLNVVVEKLQSRLPGLQDSILMWSYCKECQTQMPVMPMSGTTWKYSFGKYLELSFYSSKISFRAGLCSHDIYKDHVRYFGFHDLAVRFEYYSIDLLRIVAPRPKIQWNPENDIGHKLDLYKSIVGKINRFYDSVMDRFNKIIVEELATEKIEEVKLRIEELRSLAEKERSEALELLNKTFISIRTTELLPMNGIIRNIQDLVVKWDLEFQNFEKNYLPSEKDITRITAQQLKKIFLDRTEAEQPVEAMQIAVEEKEPVKAEIESKEGKDVQEKDKANEAVEPEKLKIVTTNAAGNIRHDDGEAVSPATKASFVPLGLPKMSADVLENSIQTTGERRATSDIAKEYLAKISVENSPSVRRTESTLSNESVSSEGSLAAKSRVSSPTEGKPIPAEGFRRPVSSEMTLGSSIPTLKPEVLLRNSAKARLKSADNGASTPNQPRPTLLGPTGSHYSFSFRKKISEKLNFPSQSLKQKFSSNKDIESQFLFEKPTGQSKVSSLAKHFEQLSRELERERARERNLLAQGRVRAFPVAKAKPIVEVFKNVEEAVEDDDKKVSPTFKPSISEGFKPSTDVDKSVAEAETKKEEEQKGKPEEVRSSIDETTPRISLEVAQVPAELQQHTAERQTLMQTLARFWADRSATGWNSLSYPLDHTEHIFSDSDIIVREDEPSSLIAFCLSTGDYLEKLENMRRSLSQGDDAEFNPSKMSELEYRMLKKTGTHLKYQFQEGPAMLSCKIFYSEQFDAFRRQCNCDESYIQSLARCVKWDSSGGKSGSAFLKTLDDRLVVKQLSPSEMDAFVKFAPSYFEYMVQAFFHDLPTVMAKIFGFYQVHIRNPTSGRTMKMDLVVMENLFYGKKMSRIFDLKGSMRNRHVQQTGRENEVLLDENMVEYIYESPLFVREYAKRLLRTSLYNDTLFLAKMNVMDYSLVIGIDEENKQLVVGIIDFIRTFTWDKKLESWVKERGLVGGGVKEPTVVSPRQYKNRFREAMERYILMVPDCWYQERFK